MLLVLGATIPQACQAGGFRGGHEDELLPNFSGTVRAINAKMLTIERPDTNTLEFNCTKHTRYYSGPKQIDRTAIKPGDRVSVETKRAPDGTLDAVNVRLDRPAAER